MKIKKVAIIGMGQFGTFIEGHLKKYFEIVPFRRDSDPELLRSCEVVIFAVSYDGLEVMAKKVSAYVSKTAVVIDVTSVKQKPIAVLKKYFKDHQILGTHPIFGPQSGKNGIVGLPMVLCNVSCDTKIYTQIRSFLKKKLELHIIEQTPKEHDHQMAHIQALTHFIGRALLHMDVQSYSTDTQSYKQLLQLRDLLKFDSWELFTTIQNTNPEAKKVRKKLLTELILLEKKLEKEAGN
jgi:prephenate dehydrogenase